MSTDTESLSGEERQYSVTELARLGNHVGMLLSILGDFKEAEEILLQALDRLKDVRERKCYFPCFIAYLIHFFKRNHNSSTSTIRVGLHKSCTSPILIFSFHIPSLYAKGNLD